MSTTWANNDVAQKQRGAHGTDKQEKMLIDTIRAFLKSEPENKRCADCGDAGPTYVCMDYGSFVCTTCSGLHRELNHKVKGVSVSKWTQEEVSMLLSRGNAHVKSNYMKHYSGEIQQPDPGNLPKLRQWLRCKYVDKKWMTSPVSESLSPSHRLPTSESKPSRKPFTGSSRFSESPPQRKSASKKQNQVNSNSKPSGETDLLGLEFASDPFSSTEGHSTISQQERNPHVSTTLIDNAPSLSLLDTMSFSPPKSHKKQGSSVADSFPSMPSSSTDPFGVFPMPPSSPLSSASFSSSSAQQKSIADFPFPAPSLLPPSPPHSARASAPPGLDPFLVSPNSSPTSQAPVEGLVNASSFFPLSSVPTFSSSSSSSSHEPARSHATEQIASHLAKSLVSKQRYQGDPFAEISFDTVIESQRLQHPHQSGVLLSPSMKALNTPHQSSSSDKSLDILITQVAALKGALEAPDNKMSFVSTTDSTFQSRQLEASAVDYHTLAPISLASPTGSLPRIANPDDASHQVFDSAKTPASLWAVDVASCPREHQPPMELEDAMKAWADFDSIPPFAEAERL